MPHTLSRVIRNTAIRRLLAIAAVGLALLPRSLRAQDQFKCRIRDFPAPELCARAGLDTVRATYIVLLDESGSMRPIWGQVKAAVETFIRAVPEGDELDIRLFSGAVRRLNAPVPASAQVVSEWANQLALLPMPTGAHTDLGVAVESALDAIAAAPASRQHFVYVLTDGAQDPDPGSAFPANGGGKWEELRKKAKALGASRPVSFAIVRLTEQADAQKLLANALPNPDVVPAITSEQLRSWFGREARNIAVRKLRRLISGERTLPALLDSTDVPLRLGGESTVRRAQLRRTTDATLVKPATVTLDDGAILTLGLMAGSEAKLRSTPPTRAWYLPPTSTAGRATKTVPVSVSLSPANELGRIGIDAGPQPDSLRVSIATETGGALAIARYWASVLVFLALLAYLALKAKWATHTATLPGRIRAERENFADDVTELVPMRTAAYPLVTPSGKTIGTLKAVNSRGRTTLWIVPGTESARIGPTQLTRRTRIHAPIRLAHSEVVFHYFPN